MNHRSFRSFLHPNSLVWFLTALLLCATAVTAQEDLTTWNKRMSMTLSGYTPPAIAETLTNFPVLVVLSNTPAGSGFNYNDFLSPPYGDLRFSTATNGTPLNYEVETWNTNGQSYVWVQVPAVTDATTTIWAFWGKGANLPSTATNGATWSNAYLGIWHMATNTTAMTDASTNRRSSTVSGVIATEPGMGGNACDFTPTAYFSVGTFPAWTGPYTVSAWINMNANASNYMAILGDYSAANTFIMALTGAVRHLSFYSSGAWRTSSNSIPSDSWKHVAYTRSSTTGVFYVDGERVFRVTNALGITVSGTLWLGSGGSLWNYPFDGRIDEIRVSTVERSSNWIAAAYQSLANSAFLSYGEPDNGGRPVVSNDTAVSDMSAVATVNGMLASTGSGTGNKVYLMWGPTDGGADFSAWPNAIQLQDGTPAGPISCVVTGTIGSTYYYRYYATNSLGDAWANPALTFSVGLLPATKTWSATAGSDSNWFNGANWTPNGVPSTGDVVSIYGSASVFTNIVLTNSTDMLGALVISNAVILFSDWTTKLRATNMIVRKSGKLRPVSGFLESEPSNRVQVVCSNLVVEPGGVISADAQGYRASGTTVSGPGKGNSSGSRATGGSYGGLGGPCAVSPAAVYGNTNAPTDPGSSGGYGHAPQPGAGDGGGAIRIVADAVVVNGQITANGGDSGTYGGGGSGGSIFITCNSFAGATSGLVRARGGNGSLADCGNGGGGRIAIECPNYVHPVGVSFSVLPGSAVSKKGQIGTLYLSDSRLLTEMPHQFDGARLFVNNFTNWTVTNLTIVAGPFSIENADFASLNVASNLTILSNAWFCVGGSPLMATLGTASAVASANLTNPVVTIGGNLTLDRGILTVGGSGQKTFALMRADGELLLTNGSSLRIYAGVTNATTLSYSALFAATGGVTRIYPQSWIYSYANPTNGGAPKFHFGDVVVATNSGFFADGTGYQVGSGPGKGGGSGGSNTGSGGGHGGKGGNSSSAAGGNPYDSSNAPIRPGSGGGNYDGTVGHGGGSVWLKARDLTLNGRITANGLGGGTYNAGGAGGGIFIDCISLTGDTNAILRANGGDRNATYTITGGGAGGRIAVALGFTDAQMTNLLAGGTPEGMVVVPPPATFLGQITASPAALSYQAAETGTVRVLKISAGYTVAVSGSPGLYGSPVPGYQNWPDIPSGSFFTNTVSTPADEANGVRHACIGWRLNQTAGGFVSSDVTTQAVFEVTEDLTLTWNWTNEYYLTVSAAVGGSATVASNGWHVDGTPVSGLQAIADPGWVFASWGGDVPMNDATNNPLTVTMSQPRNIIASYYSTVEGTNRVWSGQGNWRMSATNWSPIGRPGPLDNVVLRTGSVVRISSPETISSLVVSNGASLIFSNWNTSLTVQNGVTIRTNGLITADGPYSSPSQMSNRVWIICRNFTLDPGGSINLNSKGYFTHTGPGKGGGGGSNFGTGAGHGGKGGQNSLGASGGGVYGSTNVPQTPGSGGGGDWDNVGGHGGGVVWIDASGEVQINGSIWVNAVNGSQYNAGGSGGSILIYSTIFKGASTGALRAEGGDRGVSYPGSLGGGGGGRIAVWINVPQDQREQYLAGNTNNVGLDTTNRFFLGTVSVSNGLSCFMPPDARAPEYGTAFFFTPNPNQGTLFTIR